VKIAEGCDRPCAFCIIPQLRGPQRSRAVPDIVEEVVGLVQQGTREIRLVAQDLTKYGDDFADRGLVPANLEHLLDALVRIDGLHWIRLHYAYPTATTDGILDRIVGHAKIANYLDVPFQHVDSDVLKKMRRGYGEKQIRDLVERIHARSTSDRRIWLRTTLLVGHPGETEDAFSRLLDFIEEGHVDHLGVFPWSKEDGTASALLPLRVGEDVGRRRAEEAMAVQAELRREANLDMRGEVLEVLVDGPSSESEFLYDARHEGQAPEVDGRVIVCDAVAKPGDLLRVKIIDAEAHDLVGSVDLDREVEFRDDDV
jgi:ribosomal protein S12 methylthiotransferase